MAFAFGDDYQGKPFSGQPPPKPLRERPYSAEFEADYKSRFETQGSLKTYLATLYTERRDLLASLGADEPEIQNRPITTLRDLDTGEDGSIPDTPKTDDEFVIRHARRLVETQKHDIANMQREIEILEIGNENLKLRLERLSLDQERQSRTPTGKGKGKLANWDDIKVGESASVWSDEMEGTPIIDDSVAPSIEKDEYEAIVQAEQRQMSVLSSSTLSTISEDYQIPELTTPLADFTKKLEREMAMSVESFEREKEIDEWMREGERKHKLLASKNPYIQNAQAAKRPSSPAPGPSDAEAPVGGFSVFKAYDKEDL